MSDKKSDDDRLIHGWSPGEKAMKPSSDTTSRPDGPPPKPSDMKPPPRASKG